MPPGTVPDIAGNLLVVRGDIAAACQAAGRDPATVQIIAVTKEQSPAVLPPLAAAGMFAYGENRIDHLAQMVAAAGPRAVFHAIGRLQSRQLPSLVALAQVVHSLCDADHTLRLEKLCAAAARTLTVYLQVNVTGDPRKAGLPSADLPRLLDLARAQAHLRVVGLMTMPERVDGEASREQARRAFAILASLAQAHGLPRLSMGMSDDFALAIAEGATDVRIGRRLFAVSP